MVHFAGTEKTNSKPCKSKLLEFKNPSEDNKLYRIVYNDKIVVLPIEETESKANEALSNAENWRRYNVFTYNCESFAHSLKTGQTWSAQARQAAKYSYSKLVIFGTAATFLGFVVARCILSRHVRINCILPLYRKK